MQRFAKGKYRIGKASPQFYSAMHRTQKHLYIGVQLSLRLKRSGDGKFYSVASPREFGGLFIRYQRSPVFGYTRELLGGQPVK